MPKKRRAAAKPTYRDHAERYGKSVRTVKAWVRIGKEVNDPTPLDDPAAMIEWWTRWMQHLVPDSLWRAAGSEAMIEIPKVADPEPRADTETPVAVVDLGGGLGLAAELESLEKLARTLRVQAAQPGQTKPYLDALARLGKLQSDLRAEAEREGKLLPRDAVEAAIVSFHGPIEREIRLLFQTMCSVLGLPPSPEREAAWNAEVDRTFSRFHESIFAA